MRRLRENKRDKRCGEGDKTVETHATTPSPTFFL
jgi:hypothetical protein